VAREIVKDSDDFTKLGRGRHLLNMENLVLGVRLKFDGFAGNNCSGMME